MAAEVLEAGKGPGARGAHEEAGLARRRGAVGRELLGNALFAAGRGRRGVGAQARGG